MTSDERKHMDILCERITKEQNKDKFTQLVKELNDLLEGKEQSPEDGSFNLTSKSDP